MSVSKPSFHHTRLHEQLCARIAALELNDPLEIAPHKLKVNMSLIKEEDEENGINNEIHVVTRAFKPKEHDEIKLSKGDQVTITMVCFLMIRLICLPNSDVYQWSCTRNKFNYW